jgi:protein involved in polysaccharide export with SLBB domain
MFRPSFLVVVFLLSHLSAAFANGQTNQVARPRRIQAPVGASERQATSPEASAEAKRLYKIGVKYGHARLFKQAADTFENVVELDPSYADAYLSLGHAYYDLGQWQQAVDILQSGLALKPKDKESQDRLAHARVMLEREKRSANRSRGLSGAPSLTESSNLATSEVALTKVYRVGPGDVLDVRLTEDTSAPSALFTVTSAGLLEHPGLSAPLSCAGLTVDELISRIEDDLKRRSRVLKPSVSVGIHEYASHAIIVSGLVKEPGTKILKREAIPLYVVVADAQPLPEAGRVSVLRNESNESFVIDLLSQTEMKLLVRPGDVISVQLTPVLFFYVNGEVKSPGEKTFRPGMTLTQAIIAAGGLAKDAKEARLGRDNGKGFLILNRYKLKEINSGKTPDPAIQPGDRITIE